MAQTNLESYWICNTEARWETIEANHKVIWDGKKYNCSCRQLDCKHQQNVQGLRCGWNQYIHGDDLTLEGYCPWCRNTATIILVPETKVEIDDRNEKYC